jgi:tRNA(Ile)-lysidine synthase
MLQRVLKHIREHRLIEPGERVLVGVSGGIDSCVLLDCMVRLQPELHCDLLVAHMNHLLRGQAAEEDARFVQELAERYGLPFVSEAQDVARYAKERQIGIEVSGRKLRYQFFLRAAREHHCEKVAVGHHADDQVETVLMRLLRGSGTGGLGAMSPIRPLAERWLIRPLLPFFRDDIERYAARREIRYRTDETNRSLQFARNRIRHELLPYLATYNPRIKERLAGLAEQLAREEEFLHRQAQAAFREMVQRAMPDPQGSSAWQLDLEPFRALHPALQWRIGKLILEYLMKEEEVRRVHVADLQKLMANPHPEAALHLPEGWVARRTGNRLRFEKDRPPRTTPAYTYAFAENGEVLIREAGVRLRAFRSVEPPEKQRLNAPWAVFDAQKFPGKDVVIRNRRPGDWMRLVDNSREEPVFFTKKIKALMNEAKWPPEQRRMTPLLARGSEVLWVPGLRQSARYAVTAETSEFLYVTVVGQTNSSM